MELFALSAPWILLLLTVAAIGLLMFRRWKVAAGLLLLAVIGNWWIEVMPVNIVLPDGQAAKPKQGFNEARVQEGELKVLSFNCNLSIKHENREEKRSKIRDFVNEQDADVVFLTENFINTDDSLWLMMQEAFPYRIEEKNSVGNSLYSKYPILCDTIYKEKGKGYGISCSRIDVRGKRVEVIGVHLSSNNYNEQGEYMTPDSVESSEQAKTYLGNIVTASRCRANEASLIVNFIDSISISNKPIPTIVMGDFNDVYGSPTLNTLCKGAGRFKDAWWEGGCGYGATIHHPLPFRIDHILYNEGLKLRRIKKVSAKGLSDHDALVATFSIK